MSNDYNELNNAGWTACSIMNSLRNEAHQLAGSGATVGFPEVSKAASSLDALLMSILERGNGVSKEEESQISVLFEHLERQCFSINPYDSEILNEDFLENSEITTDMSDKKTIFLKTGDMNIERLIKSSFKYNFEIKKYSSIDEIKAAVSSGISGIALIDIDLYSKEMSGFSELAEKIKVIAISDRDDFDIRVSACRAGASEYLLKPVNEHVFKNILKSFLDNKKTEPMRVLIIDDDPILSDLYSFILVQAGALVKKVTKPELILEYMKDYKPDLVLMDIYMPEYSGFELVSVIRQHQQYSHIPVVFLSCEIRLSRQMKALSLGGDDFIMKPIRPDYLVASVFSRIKRNRMLQILANN